MSSPHRNTLAGTYTYTYDSLGNILSVTDGTYTTSYGYDSLNQLIRENDERAGKTYTYSYTNGNISDRVEYAYTTDELGEVVETKSWQYNDCTWADLLTNYNGESITYDEIGNPLTIGEKELTWLGRQLQSITDNENEIAYTYNGDGLRTSKTVNGTKTEYYYNGSILAGQKTEDDILTFMYDNNSDIFGFIYNGTEYYYIKNAQNDVTAIADAGGNIIANYYYDAWGKLIETTGNTEIAELNPIRYRSYYYDSETEWYYLNTRYYSSDMCRFINADGYVQTGQGMLDKNMFAYCGNNPINCFDNDGFAWKDIKRKFSNAWNSVKKFVNSIFGTKNTISYSYSKEKIGNRAIYIDKGKSITHAVKNSKKPIVFKTNYNLKSKLLGSSRGISINTSKTSLSYSATPIGKEWSISLYINENLSYSFGTGASLLNLSYNFSVSHTYEDDTYTDYYSLKFNTLVLVFALIGAYSIESYNPSVPSPYGPPPIPAPAN